MKYGEIIWKTKFLDQSTSYKQIPFLVEDGYTLTKVLEVCAQEWNLEVVFPNGKSLPGFTM